MKQNRKIHSDSKSRAVCVIITLMFAKTLTINWIRGFSFNTISVRLDSKRRNELENDIVTALRSLQKVIRVKAQNPKLHLLAIFYSAWLSSFLVDHSRKLFGSPRLFRDDKIWFFLNHLELSHKNHRLFVNTIESKIIIIFKIW